MKTSSDDAGFNMSRVRMIAVSSFFILNLAVFTLRMVSVWRYGAFFATSGAEHMQVYSIWKGMHHLTVYEWPFRFPFSLSLYNYLFYESYAAVLRLIGAWDAGILSWGRMLTSLFAIMGATAQWRLVQHRLSLRGIESALSLFFAVGLWLSTSMVHWWALTIRPDIPAAALVMVALWMVVKQPRFGFALAGLFFYFAWSFKQSAVLVFIGVCLFLLFQKRWGDFSALVGIFASLTAVTLFLGTPAYRFSILEVARLTHSDFSILRAWRAAHFSLAANAYWIVAPLAVLLSTGRRRATGTIHLFIGIFVLALIVGVAGMGVPEASDNYLIEAFAAGSTLLQFAVFTAPGRLASFLVLLGCVQPAMQLATAPGGYQTFGATRVATAAEYASAKSLSETVMKLKKPVFITIGAFELPWISAGDGAPALTLDPLFETDAAQALFDHGGIEGMLKRGEVPTVMMAPDDVFIGDLNSKYVRVGEAFYLDTSYGIYVIDSPTPGVDFTGK